MKFQTAFGSSLFTLALLGAGVAAETATVVCGDHDRSSAAGCKIDGTFYSQTELDCTDTAAVRCCSDTNLGFPSGKSCGQIFGYSNVPVNGGSPTCSRDKTFAEAKGICEDAGARLCSVEEIVDRCTEGTGCGYDSYHVWTEPAPPPAPVDPNAKSYWLVCGDPDRSNAPGCKDSNGDFHSTFQALETERHEVRCCSDTQLSFTRDVSNQFCPGVYGASTINGECHHASTWEEANALCTDAGARLCTQVELANGCTELSGCNHDDDWVWSSTEVGVDTELEASYGFHNVGCGDPTRASASGCLTGGDFLPVRRAEDVERHEVRCCSTDPLPFFANSPAKKNSGCAVYGITELPTIPGSTAATQCFGAKTHWEAESICSQNGARLCTDAEILKGCSRGTGCGYDSHLVWTGTASCANQEECDAAAHVDDLKACYSDAVKALPKLDLGTPFSIDGCFEACKGAGYLYAGMTFGSHCMCYDVEDDTKVVSNSMCDKRCALGAGMCGGSSAVSIFSTGNTIIPGYNYEKEYIGCYKTPSSALVSFGPGMSLAECVDECTTQNFALATLGNGGECSCSSDKINEKAVDCLTPCTKGKGLCGGITGRSLYKTMNDVRPLQNLLECKGAKSSWWGDPHMITFDGFKYNCQGIGHFVITECENYELQAMFKAATGSSGKASVTDGVAAKYKDLPKVQVSIADYESEYTTVVNSCPVHVYVDGVLKNQTEVMSDIISITAGPTGFDIQFPDNGPALRVKVRKGRGCLVDVDTCVPQECMASTVGLLGSPNGDQSDEWMYPNGTVYPRPADAKNQGGFDYCTGVWCVYRDTDSLFQYGPEKSFADYDQCADDYPGDLKTDDVPDDIKEACKDAADPPSCEQEGLIGGREAVEETKNNDLDLDVDDDDDDDDDPNNPGCPLDVKLVDVAGPGIANWPVSITEYSGDKASLEITTPLAKSVVGEYFHIYYPEHNGVNFKCDGYESLDKAFKALIDVQCMHSEPVAIVHLFVTDASFSGSADAVEIAECCHAPDAALQSTTVEYTFEVSCIKRCPTEFYEASVL